MNERPLSRILARLEALGCRPRGHNGTWRGHCPAHDDRHPSLSLKETEDQRVLVVCHAGCRTEVVLERLGLKWGDLFFDGGQHRNGSDRQQRQQGKKVNDPLGWWSGRCGVPKGWLGRLPIEDGGDHIRFRVGNLPVAKARAPGSKGFWLVHDTETGEWRTKAPDDDAPIPPFWPLLPDHVPPVAVVTEGESDACVALYAIEGASLTEKATAISVTQGAKQEPTPEAIDALIRRGCRALLIVHDVDQVGWDFARRWVEAARQRGLAVAALDLLAEGLVDPLRAEKDLRDAFRHRSVRVMGALKAAIEGLAAQASQGQTFPQTIVCPVWGKVCDATAILSSPTAESLGSLPVLGQDGVIIRGWSHLLAAPPKCGKTELLWACAQEWDAQGLRVLWVSEEAESIWAERLRRDSASPAHLRWLVAAGMRGEDILEAIREVASTFDVVVVDTLRHLFQVDEGDNAAIARTIAALDEAIGRERTRIYCHHTRKAPGQHGERTAGGLAFVGGVDRQLELSWDEHDDTRRLLRGVSRICPVPEVLLGWEDGKLKVLGHPRDVELAQVKERVLGVLDTEWRTTAQVIGSLGEPRPSDQQVRAALKSLAQEGLVERKPPIAEGDRPGCRYLWRLAPDLSSNGEDISLRKGSPEPEGDVLAQEEACPPRQPEEPPPLPSNIRPVCPRCGGESELLKTRAQCLSCLLVFTPPRIPDWALRVFQEEEPGGGLG